MNETEELDQWLGIHVPERLTEEMVLLNRCVRQQYFTELQMSRVKVKVSTNVRSPITYGQFVATKHATRLSRNQIRR